VPRRSSPRPAACRVGGIARQLPSHQAADAAEACRQWGRVRSGRAGAISGQSKCGMGFAADGAVRPILTVDSELDRRHFVRGEGRGSRGGERDKMGRVRLLCSKRSAMPSSECMPRHAEPCASLAQQDAADGPSQGMKGAPPLPQHTLPLAAAGGRPSQCAHAVSYQAGPTAKFAPACLPTP
jgi:hypothetical protein